MKVIEMSKLLKCLRTKGNYTWNDFCGAFYIFKDTNERLKNLDGGDAYCLEQFSVAIHNEFNTSLCSPALNKLDELSIGNTYFTLTELLKWNFLTLIKDDLENIQEEKPLFGNLEISESNLASLLLIINTIKDDNLKDKIKEIRSSFEQINKK